METLVISEERSHHHPTGHRKKAVAAAAAAASHSSSPVSVCGFQAGNCRAFHSGISIGILPSPPPSRARTHSSPEPRTPKQQFHHGKKRSRAISISPSTSPPSRPELWAGPGFSNSPPPSSLPIPKFSSLHPKRSISLEFPPANSSDDVEVPVHAKSAPSSPTAGSGFSLFGDRDTAIATQNLRRILHLKIDEC